MAIIKPFKAIRPSKDKAAFVPSCSYQEYSKEEAEAILNSNPFSFLHIIAQNYKDNTKTSSLQRFELVHKTYLEFIEKAILKQDSDECFYIYQIEKNHLKSCGLLCATSVAEYQSNIIKKHEETIKSREELFANYLSTVKFNAEPVLITYPDNTAIRKIITSEKRNKVDSCFTTSDKTIHSFWVISNKEIILELKKAFKNIETLYIADGHHRSASSSLLAKNLQKANLNHSGNEPYNYFMSYLIPESEIRIYEFNRMVKDLNGFTKEEFIIQLNHFFSIENKGNTIFKPTKKHNFSMYLDSDYYSLSLRKNKYEFTNSLSQLDTQILYETVLKPILGIKNLRKDKRIQYDNGKHGITKMKTEIDKGNFTVGFGLVPVTINEIKAAANTNLVMPPKSTYIEPKLRSGIAIYKI